MPPARHQIIIKCMEFSLFRHPEYKKRMKKSTILRLFCLLLLIGCNLNTSGQNLLNSRNNSPMTYIYRLDDQEALTYYQHVLQERTASLLHTLVDSFPTDTGYDRQLPPGYYLQVRAEKNQQRYYITVVHDFHLVVLDNKQDLMLRVYDLQGNILRDAKVRSQGGPLRFDPQLQAYVQRKSNRRGLLSVTHQGRTAYYDLEREINNPALIRTSKKLLLETPLRYAWLPLHYTAMLPYDTYRSVHRRRPVGAIYQAKRFFQKHWNSIACRFDDYYCKESGWRFTDDHQGYFVFNKPKYQPGDTVHLKAFVVDKKGKPVKNPVDVILSRPRSQVKLGRIAPYQPGAYTFSFVLHDSLELQLDRNYTLSLEPKPNKSFMRESFRYEDYDLSLLRLQMRTPMEQHFRGNPFRVLVKATDENDLHILDGRLEVSLRNKRLERFFVDQLFVPDTLWKHTMALDYNRETEIWIPDSAFPAANLQYEITVRLLTASNQTLTERKTISWYHQHREIFHEVKTDSIVFRYREQEKEQHVSMRVTARDYFGNQIPVAEGVSPVVAELEPYFVSYHAEAEGIQERLEVSSISPLISFYAERNQGQLVFRAHNPRNLPFSYQLFKRNRRVKKGYHQQAEILHKTRSRKNYFVSVQYLWAGQMHTQTYRVPLREKLLNLEVEQPAIVYPGQQTEIALRVTDMAGKPVKGVDVTAYGMTSKFSYTPPAVPYLGKTRANQLMVNSFRVDEPARNRLQLQSLDYTHWASRFGLDSVEYYRFSYPDGLYQFAYDAQDAITQFAPFVMKEGKPLPVHVLYVDGRPVFFSWSNHEQAWAFPVRPGKRQIRIRTHEHEILIDSLLMPAGKKLVFSLDVNQNNDLYQIRKLDDRLSYQERNSLRNFSFPYEHKPANQFSFLENRDQVIWLKPESNRRNLQAIAGPVSGQVKYTNLQDNYHLTFPHEASFSYEFAPQILKMRSTNSDALLPGMLSAHGARTQVGDEVITRRSIEQLYRQWLINNQKRGLYSYPTSFSRVTLNLEFDNANLPLQDIMVIDKQLERHFFLSPGKRQPTLLLEPGNYMLVFLLGNDNYFVVDDVVVNPRGTNYLRIKVPDLFFSHEPLLSYRQLYQEVRSKHADSKALEGDSLREAPRPDFLKLNTGQGVRYRGQVIDGSDGQALPGATIWVKDTQIGSITDINGFFDIWIPEPHHRIGISFIGFQTLELDVRKADLAAIVMTADVLMLEEVVTVGYGVERRSMTVASSVASVDVLLGKLSGLQIAETYITIRGASEVTSGGAGLILINGVPFMGDLKDVDPALIAQYQVLKGAEATALYGSRAAGGVLLITLREGYQDISTGQGLAQDHEMPVFAGHANRLRQNFSDYAFWQPQLITDKEGRARFTVSFPDDITSWETFFLAMNGKKQSGQTRGIIRSYLPLSAQLALPRFLIQSDTVYAIGKVLNYTPDSAAVETSFRIDGQEVFLREHKVLHALVDTLPIVAHTADSIQIAYTLQRADGYFDGEQRHLGVYLPGLPQVSGTFHVLDRDTLLSLQFDPDKGAVALYARADLLEVLEEEASHVLGYRYGCNEQIASKLKSLLVRKKISEIKGKPFRDEQEVNRLIRMLERNQRSRGKWGWWKDAPISPWISMHVLEALWQAKEQGYKTNLDFSHVGADWIWELDQASSLQRKLEILGLLKRMGITLPYENYIQEIEKSRIFNLNQWLQLTELRQLCQLPYQLDTLKHLRQETLFGNVYFDAPNEGYHLLNNEIQNTLMVYRILQREGNADEDQLRRMRNFFLERRGRGYWRNTYESIQIMELLLENAASVFAKENAPVLKLTGDLEREVKDFPFQLSLDQASSLQVAMQGDLPVYFTAFQRWQNTLPQKKENEFKISTRFRNRSEETPVKAGDALTLTASVSVEKDAEYVMIVIPIPASCSYADKQRTVPFEVHREYFRHEVVIFCERLPKGHYEFDVDLLARYVGSFLLNPARVELMYFPTFNAHEDMKRILVE